MQQMRSFQTFLLFQEKNRDSIISPRNQQPYNSQVSENSECGNSSTGEFSTGESSTGLTSSFNGLHPMNEES